MDMESSRNINVLLHACACEGRSVSLTMTCKRWLRGQRAHESSYYAEVWSMTSTSVLQTDSPRERSRKKQNGQRENNGLPETQKKSRVWETSHVKRNARELKTRCGPNEIERNRHQKYIMNMTWRVLRQSSRDCPRIPCRRHVRVRSICLTHEVSGPARFWSDDLAKILPRRKEQWGVLATSVHVVFEWVFFVSFYERQHLVMLVRTACCRCSKIVYFGSGNWQNGILFLRWTRLEDVENIETEGCDSWNPWRNVHRCPSYIFTWRICDCYHHICHS